MQMATATGHVSALGLDLRRSAALGVLGLLGCQLGMGTIADQQPAATDDVLEHDTDIVAVFPTEAVPEGWTLLPPPEFDWNSPAPWCGDPGRANWQVGLAGDGDSLTIGHRTYPGRIDSLVADGGVLFTEDRGEWGGRVWWRSDAGVLQTIIRENVRRLIDIDGHVIALAGIRHGASDRGSILEFRQDRLGVWTARELGELGAAPQAHLQTGTDSLLVATSEGLRLAVLPDSIRTVHANRRWTNLLPNSIAVDRDGRIFIGMQFAVARLTPNPSGQYEEEWLLPAQCVRPPGSRFPVHCACFRWL